MKQTILNKATELFYHYGIKSVSIDDICRELGMSKKTFYAHYTTKDDLVSDLLSDSVAKMDRHLSEMLDDCPFDQLLDRFASFRQASRDDVRRVPTLVYDLQKYYPTQFQVYQLDSFQCHKMHVAHAITRGIEEGYVRADLDIEMTAVFFAKVHNDAVRDIELLEAHDIPMMQFGPLALEILVRGILTPKGLKKL